MALQRSAQQVRLSTDPAEALFTHELLIERVDLRVLAQPSERQRSAGVPGNTCVALFADERSASVSFCASMCVAEQGGEVAAVVAQRMVQWLTMLPALPLTVTTAVLSKALQREAAIWGREVKASLPAGLAQFCAGRVDLVGRERRQLLLCTVGNVDATLLTNEGDILIYSDDATNDDGWSAAKGIRGLVRINDLEGVPVQRLIVSTLSLREHMNQLAALDDPALQALSHDDVALIDLHWLGPPQNGQFPAAKRRR